MAIIQKSYRGPDAWTGAANILSSFVKNKEDAYQRQRQEEADARAAAYHAQRMRNLGLDITEKERVAGNILSDEELAAQMGIAFAPSSVPTTPFNFGQYPGEGGREPATVTTGFAPTEDARNLARVKIGRGMTTDAALVIQRMQNYAHSLEQRKEQALAAGDLRAAKAEDLKLKKVNYTIALQKEKAGARKERETEERQRNVEVLMGSRGIPHAVQTGPETMDSSAAFDTSINRASPRGVAFNKALQGILLSGKDLTTAQQGEVDLQRKRAGLADVTSGKTFWDSLKESSGYDRKNYEATLAETMRNTSVDLVDPSGRSNIDEDEYTDAMRSVAKSNILEAARRIYRKNQNADPYDILNWISGNPNRYLSIESKIGDDDVIPMSIRKIVDKYLETLSQRSTTNTSNTSTGRAHTDSANPLNL